MKKQNFISVLLTVAVASAAIIGGAYAINGMRESEKNTPEQTVSRFFTDWIGYKGNPLVDRYYAESSLVSRSYSDKVDAILASFDKGGFDPILCAQDLPEGIKIINTAVEGEKALVAIEKIFSGGNQMSEVYLERQDGKWLISDIVCGEGEASGDSLNSGVSPAIQNQVGDYIRENINELSPQEAVLGGTFYINSIRFSGPNTCIVDYEDGHIAFTAEVEFSVPAANEVVVLSFELKEDGMSSFNHIGNLVKDGDSWKLVYEEPGQPALTANLKFTDDSECLDEYQDKSCLPAYWRVGDRAEIQGKYGLGTVNVSRLRIIGESSRQINSSVKPMTCWSRILLNAWPPAMKDWSRIASAARLIARPRTVGVLRRKAPPPLIHSAKTCAETASARK
jgi:hypothetical protein